MIITFHLIASSSLCYPLCGRKAHVEKEMIMFSVAYYPKIKVSIIDVTVFPLSSVLINSFIMYGHFCGIKVGVTLF